jgi:hypothetical protein
MTDWKVRCAELANYLQGRKDLECGWGEEDPEQDLIDRTRAELAKPEPVAASEHIISIAKAVQECAFGWEPDARVIGNVCAEDVVDLCSAVLARFGRPAIKPVPVAERFEFSVFNSEYEEQAGGAAPTYAQALSEGQHYLSEYSQDGPHSLEIRRVEVLPHYALPVPTPEPGVADHITDDEGTRWDRTMDAALWAKAFCLICPEMASREDVMIGWFANAIMAGCDHQAWKMDAERKPAPVSERHWERDGWCDADGKCWWGRPSEELCNSDWFLATRAEVEEFCEDCLPTVSLPHWAMPVPTKTSCEVSKKAVSDHSSANREIDGSHGPAT